MKTRVIIFLLCIFLLRVSYAQPLEKISGFSEVKISYNISSMSAGGNHFEKMETIIPWGSGIETVYDIIKRFSIGLGFEFRTTGIRSYENGVMSEFAGYSGPYHYERTENYLDFPIHLNYKFINIKFLKVQFSGGYKATFCSFTDYIKTDVEHKKINMTDFNSGLELGLVEQFKFSKRFGFFISQHYDYYVAGILKNLEVIDLKAGITLYIK